MTTRRDVLQYGALGIAAGAVPCGVAGTAKAASDAPASAPTPASASASTPAAGAITIPAPISNEERAARISAAQGMMQAQNMAGIVVEAGTSMMYFSGLGWGRGSRLTALVIPADSDPVVITPAFEASKLAELMVMPMEVRTWDEHESPTALIASVFEGQPSERSIGLERTVRHFVADGLKQDGGGRAIVSATPIVASLRQIKSSQEIALMQAANDITMAAYREVYPRVEAGMVGSDIGAMMSEITRLLGASPTFSSAQVGEASAYPHGSKKVFEVAQGQVILMDCGCDVHGYKSDISRTWVHGEANAEQTRVWNTVRKGQDIVMEMAQVGGSFGAIDDAVRAFYEGQGFGPDYKTPGLSHRTGHGIGMDIHEDQFVVRGNQTPIAIGMCFSNEPGIYLPGKFGVRSEDCLYMTNSGPKPFTQASPSIDNPMGL